MLRNYRKLLFKNNVCPVIIHKKNFLSKEYKCTEAWNNMNSSPVFNKINIHDFYNVLDQNYSSKGVLSAIDVDIFANAIKDQGHLEELKDLLHKLRTTAETGNMLESTQQATVRNFMEFGDVKELVEILKDPLNFGVFLDDYTANMLLDKLLTLNNYELAARVASLVMLQEEFNHELTCALCQYACYKYITTYTPTPSEPAPPEEKNKKVEEIKIRVKFIRNPFFDDHFDIKDTLLLSGKTLAWISERADNNLNNNLQIIGWLKYKKYDKLAAFSQKISNEKSFKVYKEVIEVLEKENAVIEAEFKPILENCMSTLSKAEQNTEASLEETLKNAIENAINKTHKNDVSQQKQLFESWAKLREQKLQEQAQRLDRARRIQLIQQKQNEMQEQEQKLWFFENEDKIDLEIEEKEKLVDKTVTKKKASKTTDEDYIPPEILPKRK
ncbi:28S ribosomal protein S27, mitochondrial [Spodoptera frugiperda]|uniref:28S ribosomal protein S27, mitochondrial n=1 Tax=Spodoptera frugiperda TaxID=7108 RepID=A0A9R0CW00_SPOFR|nr:28S ribosomal protein S27, mitochondrial [Spodoptera frugiperda]